MQNSIETKKLFCPAEFKFEDQTAQRGAFSGHGAVFGNIDLGNDVIKSGAFSKTLQEWAKKGQLPQLLWYHNNEEIIGEWTKMEEDDRGLYVEGKLWVNGESRIERAVQAYNVIKSNSVRGLSIGYRVKDQEIQENNDGTIVRILKEIELFEVSIAPWSMNPQASVTGVKSMTDDEGRILSKRDVERVLRDAKLSRRQAKAFIAGGYEALIDDDKTRIESEDRDDSLVLEGVSASINKLLSNMGI